MGEKLILLIDDNQFNITLAKSFLELGHYRVIEAYDAETGIQLCRERKPDLVLMDIQLPGMDGLTATRCIKSDKELQYVPVVALTSYAMEGDQQKAIEAGCSGYLAKPFRLQELLQIVAEFLK